MRNQESSSSRLLAHIACAVLTVCSVTMPAISQVSISIGIGTTVSVDDAQISLSGNWTNNGSFDGGVGTVALVGNGDQILTQAAGEFHNLTSNKPGGEVVLNDSITVSGALMVLAGDVDLAGKLIDLGETGSLSETAGRVKGTSGQICATRSLSAPSEDVAGLGAEITSSVNLGPTTICRGHTEQTIGNGSSVFRYFDITPTNNATLDATFVFHYNDLELNGLSEPQLLMFRSPDAGATWSPEGGTADPVANSVTLSAINTFSRWTLGSRTIHVHDLVTGTVAVGMGNRRATAAVTILDGQGNPAPGVTVVLNFEGVFQETGAMGVTDAAGFANIQSQATMKVPGSTVVDACVTDAIGLSPYDPSQNASPGFTCVSASSVHVASITTGQQNVGAGFKRGTATVTITDNSGSPSTGALVTGSFTGDFNESAGPVATDANGTVAFATVQTTRGGLTFDFCVDDVVGALPYESTDNPDPTFDCGTLGKQADKPFESVGPKQIEHLTAVSYPNPFNPSTMIRFGLPYTSVVRLAVYDVLGRQVVVLADGVREAGFHEVLFNARTLPSGIYLFRLETPTGNILGSMLLSR